MLGFLRNSGLLSVRKRRLLMCALARALWTCLGDERSRRAVETTSMPIAAINNTIAASTGSPSEGVET